MQLRSRNLADDSDMRDEEEALIEDTEDEEVDGGGGGVEDKKGIAGDERNILVLLFLYVLQVRHHD